MSRRSSPPSRAPALDAGCGSARLTLALAEAGAGEVVGIDTSRERLEQGTARLSMHPAVELMERTSTGRFRSRTGGSARP